MSEKPTPSKANEWSGDKAAKFDKYATLLIELKLHCGEEEQATDVFLLQQSIQRVLRSMSGGGG